MGHHCFLVFRYLYKILKMLSRIQGQFESLFQEIGMVCALKKVASSPNAIASKYAAQALTLIGEQVPHKLTQQVPLWTVEDVVEWVKQIGFCRYSQEFMSSKVDGDLLLQLCEQSLANDIGMTNGILRRRFLRELNLLKRMADYSSCDSTGLGAFLQGLGPEFCQYTYQMIQSGVRMCNLRCLSEEQLQTECAIQNSIHRMRLIQAVKVGSARNSVFRPEEELDPKSLDVFISYRRSSGSLLASLLKVHLQLRSFSVFIDVEKLEAGKFDNNLLNSVRQAKHFILVLTPNALDRCVSDLDHKDWVHREIVEALNSQCNIIPVLDNFQWPDPETLPEDMRAISYFNGVSWIHDYQEACVDKIERFMRGEMNVKADGPIGRLLNMGGGGCSTPSTPGGSALPRMLAHNSFQRSNSSESK